MSRVTTRPAKEATPPRPAEGDRAPLPSTWLLAAIVWCLGFGAMVVYEIGLFAWKALCSLF